MKIKMEITVEACGWWGTNIAALSKMKAVDS